jgi:hypothetical protein
MSDITFSLLAPTRNRPEKMERSCKQAFQTADNPDKVEVIYYIDNDDLKSIEKADELAKQFNVRYIVGDRIVLSEMWNKCHEKAQGQYFFTFADDVLLLTQGWDSIVENKFLEFDDRIAFVYGDDLNPAFANHDFGTHGFLHKNWVQAVGYFFPPYFSSDYNDTWLNEVSKAIGRHFFVKIITEHLHPGVGKAEWDTTHIERLARHRADNVEGIYQSKQVERQEDCLKLLNFIEQFSNKGAIIAHED